MTYQIATGWNNAGSLADMSKQPRTTGIRPGRLQTGGDGLVYEDGFPTTELEYGFLTETEMNTQVTEFGVASARSAKMTIRIPENDDRSFANYNCVMVKPSLPNQGRHDRGLWLNVRFPVTRLVSL